MQKIVVSLICLILISSCGGHIAKLPLPPELVLPRVTGAELECLASEPLDRLVKISQLRANRIKTLENIILTTH